MARKGRMNTFDKKRKCAARMDKEPAPQFIPGVFVPGVDASLDEIIAVQTAAVDAGMLFAEWPTGSRLTGDSLHRILKAGQSFDYFVPSFPGEQPPRHDPDPAKCEACAHADRLRGHDLPLPPHVSDWAMAQGGAAIEVMLALWRTMGLS